MTVATAEQMMRGGEVIDVSSPREDGSRLFFTITQTLAWALFNVYFRSIYKINVDGIEHLRAAPKPLIVIANHFGVLDGFLLNAVSGLSCPQRPFRFMAVTRFNLRSLNVLSHIGFIALVYKMFGVFTVVPGMGMERNLERAKEIIKGNGTVVIFPEGKIVNENAIKPFRNGAAALAISTATPIIPVSFRKGSRRLLRRDFFIRFGPLIELTEPAIEDGTARLYEAVTRLYSAYDDL